MGQSDPCDGSGMGLLVGSERGAVPSDLLGRPVAASNELPKTAGGCLHIRRGIVRFGKVVRKEVGMQFGQLGDFKPTPLSSHDLRDLGRCLGAGIQYGQLKFAVVAREPHKFSPHDLQVKTQVVANHVTGLGEGRLKGVQHLGHGMPLGLG